jgi:protein-disulfide isomerase
MSTSRKAIKEMRLKKKRQQRTATMLVIVVVALLLVAFMAIPSIVNKLRPAGPVTAVTSNPRPLADGRTMGNPDAPVVVEVFEDFQCPMCAVYTNDAGSKVVENYIASGQVYYVFRQYPFLDDTKVVKESDQAANASMCAAEQGSFWEYQDILFANQNGENQGAFNDKRLIAFAESISLDIEKFNSCFEENRYQADIDSDIQRAEEYGVSGTPSVFVNGQAITPGYVPSFETLQQAIEAELATSGG